MSVKISLDKLALLFTQVFENYQLLEEPLPSISLHGEIVLLINYMGKKGLCVPLSWYNNPPTTKIVELKYIYEALTVEEMLTHESEEVRIWGSCIQERGYL